MTDVNTMAGGTATPAALPPIELPNMLVGVLAGRIRQTMNDGGPPIPDVLEWLATQKPEVVKEAIKQTQPRGWSVAAEPLLSSLSNDQACAVLAALVAVFIQTIPA